jgi:putative ABC transport system permease protein
MLLGGASPVEAGAVQLFVLVGLMAVQGVAVAAVLELVARGRLHRREGRCRRSRTLDGAEGE